MSEETNEGGLSGLKKTLIGTLTTVITAGGVWLTTRLFGGEATDKEEVKTEVAAPAPTAAPVIINLQNNNTNQQKQSGGTHTVVKERVIEKASPSPAPAQKESW
jgi:flagellar basal body-associated protein FliL